MNILLALLRFVIGMVLAIVGLALAIVDGVGGGLDDGDDWDLFE